MKLHGDNFILAAVPSLCCEVLYFYTYTRGEITVLRVCSLAIIAGYPLMGVYKPCTLTEAELSVYITYPAPDIGARNLNRKEH